MNDGKGSSRDASRGRGTTLAASLLRHLALGVAWLVLWRVSALMEYAPHASIWFPPAGLSFAAFLVLGLRAVPVLLICAVISTFWADAMYATALDWQRILHGGLLFGLAHSFAYYMGAVVLRRMIETEIGDRLPALIIAFLLLAAFSALLAAFLGVQMLVFGGVIGPENATGLWVPWWIGDMAGAIVLAPLFAGLIGWRDPGKAPGVRHLDFLTSNTSLAVWLGKLALLASLLTLIMVTTAWFGQSELLAFAVFFLIIPQMWITYTESGLRVALSLAVFCTLTAVLVGVLDLMERAMIYQFAITVIAASTYFGLAVPFLVDQNRRLRRLADADELTGATRRRSFFDQARLELARARHAGEPACLVLFDLDNFKPINDELGHVAGDRALVAVADAVRGTLRQGDLFGRFGGDEFMLLLVGCNRRRAVEILERLHQRICDIPLPGIDWRLSATFGIVRIDERENLAEAFERVDGLLLAAKREQRGGLVSDWNSG